MDGVQGNNHARADHKWEKGWEDHVTPEKDALPRAFQCKSRVKQKHEQAQDGQIA
ncbi:hypothetical protein K250101E9_31660 [Enterocloster aldenensis]